MKGPATILMFTITCLACEPSEPKDTQLITLLEHMHDTDQEVRQQDRIPEPDRWMRMQLVDETNQHLLDSIYAIHGWIPKSRISEKAADAIFLITQHGNDSTMAKRLPDLKNLSMKGEAKKTHTAMMEDRVLMNEGKKQKYGTQAFGTRNEDGSFDHFIWPIEDPEGVNQHRRQMGFDMTVEENTARLKSRYDKNEPLPKH